MMGLALFSLGLSGPFLAVRHATAQQTFTVINADDGGAGSLRIAMGSANLAPGADTIVFDPEFFSTPRTITLNGVLPPIGEELTINGPGANLLTVSGNNQDRVFEVASGVPASLSGLTITEGFVNDRGAGIRSEGPLTLTDVAVVGNHSTDPVNGGGGVALLSADGVFTRCTVSGNTTVNAGGGIFFLSDGGHALAVVDSTISGNSSATFGAGIFHIAVLGSGTLQVVSSTIAHNAAAIGGGIQTVGVEQASVVTTLRNSIIANNIGEGGNLVVSQEAGGTATVTSLGFNLTSDDGGGFLNASGDQINKDPLLGPLQYNGGQTATHMLLDGSPALDAGASGGVDQRGVARPFDIPGIGPAAGGDNADIGAVEAHALIVTNAEDSGAGSLRQALTDANANEDLDDILFDRTFFTTPRIIRLASALPLISNSLTINGPAAKLLTVSGNHQNRVFDISFSATASLSGLTVSDGRVQGPGAGIRSGGTLTLTNVAVVGNHAFDFGFSAGGGVALIVASGVFTNCTFSGNTSAALGGGILFQSAPGFTLQVIDSTISGNSSATDGGGIYHQASNTGGTLEVINTTIANNTGPLGGGILTITSLGTVETTLRNSIIANNIGPDLAALATSGGTATITSLGFNLTSDAGGGFLAAPGDQINKDPLLGPLQHNGGETPTHMLLAGSPALDKGNSSGAALDQRGRPRGFDLAGIAPAAGGDNSDIGAVEVQARIVTNADDSGSGSLRQVVADAPANSDILFDASFFNVARTIGLTSEIPIDKDQTINGPGADLLAISGGDTNRIFRIAAGGLHVAISGVTIMDGKAADVGGGIVSNSNLTLSRCIIVNNAAGSGSPGGGVHVRGALATFTDCVFKDNMAPGSGGAVFLIDATGTFTGCTLSGNEAGDRGGAVALAGSSAGFTNCTISGNMAPVFGGGIALFTVNSDQTLAVTNSTVTANTGTDAGGIRVEAFGFSAAATVRNSIVARNFGPNLQTTATGGATATIASLGYNLNDDDNTFFNQPTDQIDTDPMLGPLQNNFGFTETHALLPGSPAIDKGSSSGSSTDQRGRPRPLDDPALPNADGGDGADIGAFELDLPPPAATATSTLTPTPTPTASVSATPTTTGTATNSTTVTGTPTNSATVTPTQTGAATPTRTLPPGTATATLTPTSTSGACAGDCDGSGQVAVNELVLLVNIALGSALPSACPAGDTNRDSTITINELVAAVNSALNNCPV